MSSWKGKTRGGLLGYKIFIYILRNLGLSAAYTLLRFVAAYFVVSAPRASAAIYKYFREIIKLGKWKAFLSVYQSYFIFGQTLIDKIAIASGMQSKFRYTFDGVEHLKKLEQTGGIVLSAHLGNWEIAGMLMNNIDLKTNILIFEAEHEKIKNYLKGVMTESKVNIISIKQDMSHVFEINAALKNKEVICVHGDRFVEGSRVLGKQFMGKKAFFPLGPFSIASKLAVPYSIAYAVRGKKNEYHLSATPIRIADQGAETLLDEYVANLESKLKQYPLQWFNYYNFWSKDMQGAIID